MDLILTPPIAFVLYIPLVMLILWFGRVLAGTVATASAAKTSVYGCGEASPTTAAAPGYRPFFLIAFFFAIVHLGMLVLGIGSLPVPAAAYIVGLLLALAALILG
jgi:NADH:ubiquinone oxidoreductase subunit 3 (subunit A)